MANENLKKQMVVKLGTTTNTEAQLISNMVDGALSGKGGNDPELESLKKQMVIKLGTTTNEDAQIISNMVDNAAGGGGGGGSSIPLCEITFVQTASTTGSLTIGLNNNCYALDENGLLITNDKTYAMNKDNPVPIKFLVSELTIPGEESTTYTAGVGVLHGISADYTEKISNIDNVSIVALPMGEGVYGYMVCVIDITKPASLTYTSEWSNS